MQFGYELGHARQEQVRLREVKRVLSLEVASFKTPERVEIVARTLLGMEAPAPERVISIGRTSGVTRTTSGGLASVPTSEQP
jgi:cell division protein FtsL